MIKTALIACPTDAAAFMDCVKEGIRKFNAVYGTKNKIFVNAVYWEDCFSTTGEGAQPAINNQLGDSSDICIAVFWTRFGTETDRYGSGTEEEIERALSRSKQTFLYFIDKEVPPSSVDFDQLKRLSEFKNKWSHKSLYFNVKNEVELEGRVKDDLEKYFNYSERRRTNTSKAARNVLWVDDNPENNFFLIQELSKQGLSFSLASTTNEAIALSSSYKYSLIISDMRRAEGEEEGYRFLSYLRKRGDDIPYFIFSSDGSLQACKDQAKNLGADGSTNEVWELMEMVTQKTER